MGQLYKQSHDPAGKTRAQARADGTLIEGSPPTCPPAVWKQRRHDPAKPLLKGLHALRLEPGTTKNSSRTRFGKRWRSACEAAGVPGRLLHDFRRTALRNLERHGVSRSVAMKITGHKTESVYRRYAIVSDADLQEAARKMATPAVGGGVG